MFMLTLQNTCFNGFYCCYGKMTITNTAMHDEAIFCVYFVNTVRALLLECRKEFSLSFGFDRVSASPMSFVIGQSDYCGFRTVK